MRLRLLLAAAVAVTAVSRGSAQSLPDEKLLAEVRSRWAQHGFKTGLARANGVMLHVAQAGQGDPIVLLHGYPQSGEIWRAVAPELAKTHHVIVVDLRGMGLSEAASGGYDLGNVAEDIHQLVRSMGIAKVKLAGHDWGAAAAAVYAMRYRGEVSKLAFLESVLAGEGFEAMWDFSKPNPVFTFIPFLLMGEGADGSDITADLIRGREGLYLHHLWSGFTGDRGAAPFSAWAPYVAAMSRPGIATSSSSYYRAVYRSAGEVKALVRQKLDIPVLAIAGEKGIGSKHQAFVEAFAARIQKNVILPGAGHFVAEERPAEVSSALKDFFAN